MYCMKCGALIEPHNKYCSSCGTQVNQLSQTKSSTRWLSDSPKRQQTIINAKSIAATENSFMGFIKKWGTKITILIVATFFAVLGKDLGRVLTEKYNNASVWERAVTVMIEEKNKLGVPKRLDDNTILSDMFIQDKSINYLYKINEITLDNDSKNDIKSIAKASFINSLCANVLIDKYQGSVNYIYKFSSDSVTYTFTKSDCPSH
ncbi:zinc ribbon domain-containing protein [Yersinia alsatica]|uniref:zinc ribbon domain-containing protein n=1 Tax=Yersinia alsatica TaxID=2890317 RepID=UPI0011A83298|nr:zinc ribbon domain-containing protein [Yersinia alsatica]